MEKEDAKVAGAAEGESEKSGSPSAGSGSGKVSGVTCFSEFFYTSVFVGNYHKVILDLLLPDCHEN